MLITVRRPSVGDRAAPVDAEFVPVMQGPNSEIVALGARTERRYWVRVPNVADFSWTLHGRTISALPAADSEPDAVRDALESIAVPFHLHTAQGFEALHASAVASERGVVALCGPTGFGKSTLAQGLALRNRQLWADDVVAFKAGAHGVETTALPFEPNLRSASRGFFVGSRPETPFATSERAAAWAESPLLAIIALEPGRSSPRAGASAAIDSLDAADSLAAILPHGLRFKPASANLDRRIATAYATVVSRVPILRLTYRRGFDFLAEVLDSLEAAILGLRPEQTNRLPEK